MKKIIILFLLFLVTGCSVDYKLVIDENNEFKENITIISENEIESDNLKNDPWPIKAYYSDLDAGEAPEKLNGVEYYKDELDLNNNYYEKNLSYNFKKETFNDVNSIKSCYEHFYLKEDEENITLSTSSEFLCMVDYPDLSEVNIEIEVANKVIVNNANEVDGNTYKWQINKDNYENSGIILTFQKNNSNKESVPLIYLFGVLGCFLIVIIGLIIFKIRNNR